MTPQKKKFQFKATFCAFLAISINLLTIFEKKNFLHKILDKWPLCPPPGFSTRVHLCVKVTTRPQILKSRLWQGHSQISIFHSVGFVVSMWVCTVEINRERDFWNSQEKLLKNVEIFSTVEETFWIFSVEIFKIETFSVETRSCWDLCRDRRDKSRLLRWTFWKCQDFLDCRDKLFDNVKIETLNWDQVETNWGPQAYCVATKRPQILKLWL